MERGREGKRGSTREGEQHRGMLQEGLGWKVAYREIKNDRIGDVEKG